MIDQFNNILEHCHNTKNIKDIIMITENNPIHFIKSTIQKVEWLYLRKLFIIIDQYVSLECYKKD